MTSPAGGGVPPLVLASASARRTDLLAMLGVEHAVDPAGVPEALPGPDEPPGRYAERLARAKCATVAGRHPGALVLAGDTVVALDGRVLGKPADEAEAVETLLSLAGRTHSVFGGLALALPAASEPDPSAAAGPDPGAAPACPGSSAPARRLLSRVDTADVTFRGFGRDTAAAYVATREPMDKAGAYGIQGLGSALVSRVEGDYHTVVGLSVHGLLRLLEDAGYRYAFPGLRAVEGAGARPSRPRDRP